MRGILTHSFIATLGYWYATLVGLVWGFIWSTGPVQRRNGLFVFTGMPRWTFRRGGTCVGACYLTRYNAGTAVLRHEAVHRQQWKDYGLLFPILYAAAGGNPLTNRFEVEAGLEDGGYLR